MFFSIKKPYKIDGRKVVALGNSYPNFGKKEVIEQYGNESYFRINSEKLKKMYISCDIKLKEYFLVNCNNLERLIFIKIPTYVDYFQYYIQNGYMIYTHQIISEYKSKRQMYRTIIIMKILKMMGIIG